jgi:hypothetical protein
MLRPSHLICGALATALIYSHHKSRQYKRATQELLEMVDRYHDVYQDVTETHNQLVDTYDRSFAMNVFMVDLMTRYEYPLDEFDALALKYYTTQ